MPISQFANLLPEAVVHRRALPFVTGQGSIAIAQQTSQIPGDAPGPQTSGIPLRKEVR